MAERQHEGIAGENPSPERHDCYDNGRSPDVDVPQDVALHLQMGQVLPLDHAAQFRQLHQLDEHVHQYLKMCKRHEVPGDFRHVRGVGLDRQDRVQRPQSDHDPVKEPANQVGLVWQAQQMMPETGIQVH
eukprot:CAMPEP_0198507364 /NCGR_PEP_ID=MMETSP1462-20131121/12269_1 /TAXON_ID=1333877 /ORGANISM="Brandtodinium nutriculum, Strain RCC3387" /LENGTH=129 /DNA_ID=CAMNT_0044236609 /DNA_START=88 /DNA_END=477 /DNA_ORIENTATION=+